MTNNDLLRRLRYALNLNGVRSYPVADLLAARGVPFAFATSYGGHPAAATSSRSSVRTDQGKARIQSM